MFQAVVCMNSDDKAFVTISLTPALSEINRHPVLEMRLVGGGRGGGGYYFSWLIITMSLIQTNHAMCKLNLNVTAMIQ